MTTILLTGIPRSGTTLACSLLNQLPDTLALVEPMDMNAFANAGDAISRRDFIDAYQCGVRESVLTQGEVKALVVDGEGTNTFASGEQNTKRKTLITGTANLTLTKKFSQDFTLIIKHPNAFSALLPELIHAWKCYAIVRNPLAILASWHSLDHPLSRGRAPMAEAFDSDLKATLDDKATDLDRQLVLMNWYFSRYRKYLPVENIFKYEDIVLTGGRALAPLISSATQLDRPLTSRNTNHIYDIDFIRRAADTLAQWHTQGCAWSDYYDQASISKLAHDFISVDQ